MELFYISPCYVEDLDSLDALSLLCARGSAIESFQRDHPTAAIAVGPLLDLEEDYCGCEIAHG